MVCYRGLFLSIMKPACYDNKRNDVEVADIFRLHGEAYRHNNGMTKKQLKVMNAISKCRTSAYGYHVDQCDVCGFERYDFNSCRDRHCPKCQAISKKKWINARMQDLLPVAYYHFVFTLPHLLQPIIGHNKTILYELLFNSASRTLMRFGQDPRWLGGDVGFYGILHTWGQTLWPHPHVHIIMPAGALANNDRWIEPRYKNRFLFPVRALSKVFRGKFIQGLKKAYQHDKLVLPDQLSQLNSAYHFEKWIDQLVARNWVVYCKSPFKNAERVLRYIGRYTHRVAISNSRIVELKNAKVSFRYKDYKLDRKAWKTMTLTADEFIRRFIFHVLPARFHKIRHYGFLANGRAKHYVQRIRAILCDDVDHQNNQQELDCGIACKVCGSGKLLTRLIVTPFKRLIKHNINDLNRVCAYDTS